MCECVCVWGGSFYELERQKKGVKDNLTFMHVCVLHVFVCVCVCVCVCEREKERERECVCACVLLYPRSSLLTHIFFPVDVSSLALLHNICLYVK